MPTIVVKDEWSAVRRWVSLGAVFIAGWCLGALMGVNKGAEIAAAKYSGNCISLKEYYRLSDENERIGLLYYAERKRIVELTGKHGGALRIGMDPPIASTHPTKAHSDHLR